MASRAASEPCPKCGYRTPVKSKVSIRVYPWRLHCRSAVADYVASLAEETYEWLIALYVNQDLDLLAVDTIARGSTSECPINVGTIICHGARIGAAGFFLVHNHPSGDSRPSLTDRQATMRIARIARELDLPLIEHFVVGSHWMESVVLG